MLAAAGKSSTSAPISSPLQNFKLPLSQIQSIPPRDNVPEDVESSTVSVSSILTESVYESLY
jgi:hypothetical protein